MSNFPQSRAYPWALIGVFAALHLVITLVPYNIAFGGGEISFGMVSAPLVGFLLGPFFGTIAVIIGSVIAMLLHVEIAVMGPFTVLATAAGAFAAGMIRSKKPRVVPILYLISIVVYLISPIGILVPEYTWFHGVAFLFSILFVSPRVSNILQESFEPKQGKTRVFVASIWLLSIVSITMDQAVGSAIGPYYFVVLLGNDAAAFAGFFEFALLLYPIERLIGSLILTIVLVPLTDVLSQSNLGIPITSLNPLQYEELCEKDRRETGAKMD
ncbi:hypothetical protein EU537_02190 [Candidatus Thorarchaeota archaeon]|nr:MAG: hypothetical protein EU537_02190 [Candidatus Thorarchaeota archaeon]